MNVLTKYSVLFSVAMAMMLSACAPSENVSVEPGVSRALAKERKGRIHKLTYDLMFDVPEGKSLPINAKEIVRFNLSNNESSLVLDFNAPEGSVSSLLINGQSIESPSIVNEHMLLPSSLLEVGDNEIEIVFIAGDLSLNRNVDFLYTLFVPDRASTAFPCFDQPDLKAKFKLELVAPTAWQTMSNAPLIDKIEVGDKSRWTFDWSDKMSTYLFSFVVGVFEIEKTSIGGVDMTMLHRETDSEKIEANKDSIFQLHYEALKWMEDYTGIDYPFKKFDFALIPGFQYGGMEHVGAIQYRASSLLLDNSATLDNKIRRSMLIAHETAHMWFGNLVTMEWFDDVWLKEVFANFMASKITEPNFPDVNHDLNFLFSHYPQAYAVDRTSGANPIKQNLNNLKNAGSMYGAIIYHKAPIAMRQMEKLLGEKSFRLAMKSYLTNFSGGNATWSDLIAILDLQTTKDLTAWSNVWIESSGMPFIDLEFNVTESLKEYDVNQYDLTGDGRVWPQHFTVLFSYEDKDVEFPIYLDGAQHKIRRSPNTLTPQFMQMNSDGLGYGVFSFGLDYVKNEFLFHKARVDIPRMPGELRRGAAYVSLHEFLLYEGMNPQLYLSFLEDYVREESNKLMISYLLDNLEQVFWKFMPDEHRLANARAIETTLMNKMNGTEDKELKYLLLKKYISIGTSDDAVKRMRGLWDGSQTIPGVDLSLNDKIKLAFELAIKDPERAEETLNAQLALLENKDKKDRMSFIMPALSNDPVERDNFFNSLKDATNREHESWVTTAVSYLHHPLRRQHSIKYLSESLDLLEELQRTGDIFFPKRWLDNTLRAYQSPEAVALVEDYLNKNPQLDPKLRQKLLQSADLLFKAERDISEYLKLDADFTN